MVQLFAYTGGDGMFGASGEIASEEDLSKLRKFMESTSPPRPIYLNFVQVLGPEFFEFARKQAEPGGAANRSQPVRPETNRTSAAAGSGR